MNPFNAAIKGIKGNSVAVNGNIYSGSNIQIINGKVLVDGKEVECPDKKISISINGNVDSVCTASGDVTITGNVGNASTTSGDIEIEGNVSGNVSAVSGDISVLDVQGNVSTVSGDITRH